jgi:DNA polymerase III epsilon subunit-like protein
MANNFRKFIVFDFETDGVDPHTCNPVQVAAIAIDPRKLEIIPNSEFNMMMRPPGIEKPEYTQDEKRMDTIQWHANLRGVTTDEVIQKWKDAPDQEYAWKQFSSYVDKFNFKKNDWFAPIACGANIREFDLPIAARLNEKHKVSRLFWNRDKVDLLDMCFLWFNWVDDAPKNYKVDTLRDHFGMSKENSHDALQDVKDCASLIIRFLKLHNNLAQKITFRPKQEE